MTFATHSRHREPHVPRPEDLGSTAWLLDVDGTILDTAATPDAVVVPEALLSSLADLHARSEGAFALVSGRMIRNLDRLFAPLRLPAIGVHGAEMRLSGNQDTQERSANAIGETLHRLVTAAAASDPGIIVEDKGSSLAVHYRLAPRMEQPLKNEIAAVISSLAADDVEVLHGKAVIEIKSKKFNKGEAVVELMKYPPFADRRPVFVGDDTTDESVFNVLPKIGGIGYSVGRFIAGANGTFNSPSDVRGWLAHLSRSDGSNRQ